MFSVCSVKMEFLFPANMKLSFGQIRKYNISPKSTPKDDIFSITEKDNIHPRKDDIGIVD